MFPEENLENTDMLGKNSKLNFLIILSLIIVNIFTKVLQFLVCVCVNMCELVTRGSHSSLIDLMYSEHFSINLHSLEDD
jgi:hypothetical protein